MMEHKYAEIFIDACSMVLDSFSSRRIASANVTSPNCPDSREIFVSMGLAGDIDGQVTMSMDAETGKSLAGEMLGGMEITDVDELVTSAVGELCNMIMGNACSELARRNLAVDITAPCLVDGEWIFFGSAANIWSIPIVCPDYGTLHLDLAFHS